MMPEQIDVIFQTTCSSAFFIQISLDHDPDCQTDNKSALVCIMACRLLGAKPLPEPEMTEFNDAFIHHQASAC